MAEAKDLVEFEGYYALRKGDVIDFGRIYTRLDGGRFHSVRLRVALIDDGLMVEQKYVEDVTAFREHRKAWQTWFLDTFKMDRLTYNHPMAEVYYHIPPRYIHTDENRLEYLRSIARERIKIHGVGPVRLSELKKNMRAAGVAS